MRVTTYRMTSLTLRAKALFSASLAAVLTLVLMSAAGAAPAVVDDAPLFADLGTHRAEITSASAVAQRYFNQGLILSYGFNHAEAVRSFRAAQHADPSCAMCFWGEAYALGPNINKPMDRADVAAAHAAAAHALALADNVSERERAYIQAMGKRYVAAPGADRRSLDRAFADAMAEVVDGAPNDLDAATIYAEALMNLMPWAYYAEDGSAKPMTDTVIAMLESVLARNPQHPGAMHYYIHAVEASSRPQRAEAAADRLGREVPGIGHLVHMPSHIYLRTGRYHDATLANERASLADESYISQCHAQGFYPALYYPHNVHFLWYSASLEGRSEVAVSAARKLAEKVPRDLIASMPMLEQFLAVPLFGLIRFARWDEVLAEVQPPAGYHFATAMWHAARGIAYGAKGMPLEAQRARSAFADIAATFGADAYAEFGYPANSLLRIAGHVLDASVAGSEGNNDRLIAALQSAVTLEDRLPYMEPPYWFFPNRHLLGAALLKLGRAAEAEAVYRRDLEKLPANGWSLLGLSTSLAAQGKSAAANAVHALYEKAWQRADITRSSDGGPRYF
jgi:tetratricopeptide (TPR) repeat protein